MKNKNPEPIVGLFSDITKLEAAEGALKDADPNLEIHRLENINTQKLAKESKAEELNFLHFMTKLFAFQTEKDMDVDVRLRAYFHENHPERKHVLIISNPSTPHRIEAILERYGAFVEEFPRPDQLKKSDALDDKQEESRP